MSMHDMLSQIALHERCKSRTQAMLGINLVHPEKVAMIDANVDVIFAATSALSDEQVKQLAEDISAKLEELEAILLTVDPRFVVNVTGNIAGVRAAFDNAEHKAKFEAENAALLAQMRAEKAASQGTMEA